MAKKKEIYWLIPVREERHEVDNDQYLTRDNRRKKDIQKAFTEKLRVKGKRRKKTESEKEGKYSIYTGSFFRYSAYGSSKKSSTLEIIYLITRFEIRPGRCTCFAIEEWNGRAENRMLTKRYFYRDDETGQWKAGRKVGLNYLDLEHLMKETKEGTKIRAQVTKLLEEPFSEED